MIFFIMIPLIVIVFTLGLANSVVRTRRFRRSGDFPTLRSHDDPINPWTPSTNSDGHHHGHHGSQSGGHNGGHHGIFGGHGGGWGGEGGHHDGGGSVGGHHG